ncbi:unnamed protein product, partial [marine sediment metagenome]
AIIDYVLGEPSDKILFIVGRKSYTAKEVLKAMKKGNKLAEEIINLSVKSNCTGGVILTPDVITEDVMQATLQMWKR